MSTSPTSTDLTELQRIWLCNGCFGRSFFTGFYHGVTNRNYMRTQKNTRLTAYIGSETIILTDRTFSKNVVYRDEWFDPHGIIYGPPQDNPSVGFWGAISGNCWGAIKNKEWEGSYVSVMQYVNHEIYFCDLRDDILVYRTEEGRNSQSGSNNKPIGLTIAYAAWNGLEPSCKGVNLQDAIAVKLTSTASFTTDEVITNGNYKPYSDSDSSVSEPFNVAAADPFSSVLDMDVIDTSKSFNCQTGEYTSLIDPHESLWIYANSWTGTGSFSTMDAYDAGVWDDSFNKQGAAQMKDGTYDYPSFVNIDAMPHGSFATDASGNYFYSMITKDMKTFNKLNTDDPNDVAGLTGGGIVFYPVAPA